MTIKLSTFSIRPTLQTSWNELTRRLTFGALIAASFALMSGAAQATCAFNGPNCISGNYPDLAADQAWVDAAVSQSDAGANGANADNLPLPARTTPPKPNGAAGTNEIIAAAGKKH